MTRGTPDIGTYHLCGNHGERSFEHVPPRAAFNNRAIIIPSFEDIMKFDYTSFNSFPQGRTQQRGAGAYTLCHSCNNKMGAWYGNRFVQWCYKAMEIMVRSDGNPTLFNLYHVFPLAILKQIVTMFFSVNSENFREPNHELVDFVLNKEKKYLSPKYRFFVYFHTGKRMRFNGSQGRLDISSGKTIQLGGEISFPPFGYLMTIDSEVPDERLIEITHFSRYSYNDFKVMALQLPVLPTHTFYSGDYRTKEELLKQRESNKLE